MRQLHTSLPTPRSLKPTKAYRMAKARVTPIQPVQYYEPQTYKGSTAKTRQRTPPNVQPVQVAPSPEAVRKLVLRSVPSWISSAETVERLTSLGLEWKEVTTLLNEYQHHIVREITSEQLTNEDPWSVAHILDLDSFNERAIVDRVLTMRFFAFSAQQGLNIQGVSAESISTLRRVNDALDMRYPAEGFSLARRLRRKIYLHVGPTNSGKTYHALRALADATSGVYAGPLRLLAHEVWERLNRGLIRPHDTDAADALRYARPCNLVTGEESRIVSESASLVSCTVEMVNLYAQYSVAVIDEIQMIADPERGHAWTSALLGVSALEVHLCGEEAAVPLITELMRETGDDLEVKYYKRLTPLVVADRSLEGRWNRIQKGDCVVTFSRKAIFSLKRIVEEKTGLRCAVAYGRLPPETRSEQAALFNSPHSGYDVMVASDAIGMGLNLKIKRVVFVQLMKYNGIREVLLSSSHLKQIGGRAGRYGEHGDSSSVGIVTCLHPTDLPILADAFKRNPPRLLRAYLPLHLAALSRVAQFFPQSLGVKMLHSLLVTGARVGRNYSIPKIAHHATRMDVVDRFGSELKLVEKMLFVMAPAAGQAPTEMEVFVYFVRQFAKGRTVDPRIPLDDAGLLVTLERVTEARLDYEAQPNNEARGYSVQTTATLETLETLHRVLVTYSWLSLREPVTFNQQHQVKRLKEETEKGIEFVLEGIANMKQRGEGQRVKSIRQLREERMDTRIGYMPRASKMPMVLKRTKMSSS